MDNVTDLEIKRYRPEAGDILIVKTPDNLSTAGAAGLVDAVRSALGEDCPAKIMVLFGSMSLEVVRRDDDELKSIILETMCEAWRKEADHALPPDPRSGL